MLTTAAQDAALGDIIATGKEFDPAGTYVGLLTAITAVGGGTTLADCTLGTDGILDWVEITTWSSIRHNLDGSSAVDGPLITFAVTNSTDAQTVVALGIGDASVPTTLKAYYLLAEPYAMPDQYTPFTCVVSLVLGSAGLDVAVTQITE